MSGIPSLSVSRCTVIVKLSVDSFPDSSLAVTFTVKSLSSSSLPQSLTSGVPVIVPSVIVTPSG